MQEQEPKVKIVRPQTGITCRLVNSLITFKATAADTNGLFSLFEIYTPLGEGMLPHLQRYDDEAFWVLEGTYTFLFNGREFELGVGGYAFVPRGTVHGFINSGGTDARTLNLITPGGIHERFFKEADETNAQSQLALAPSGPAEIRRVIKIAEKYGIEMLLPSSG